MSSSNSPSANLDPTAYLWGALNPLAPITGTMQQGIFTAVYSPLSTGVTFIDDSWGPSVTFPTAAATIGSQGGIRLYSSFVTHRARNPTMNCIFKLNQTADTLLYIGFHDSLTAAPAGTDPLNGMHGFGLAINGGEFKVAHNEGTGATVFDDLQSVTPVDMSTFILTINVDSSTSAFRLSLHKFSTANTPATLTVTSEIPDPTQGLTGAVAIETEATAIKELVLHRWEMFC